jgi:hypothetical protein
VSQLFDAAVWEYGDHFVVVVELYYRQLDAALIAPLFFHEIFDVVGAEHRGFLVFQSASALLICLVIVDEVVDDSLGAIDEALGYVKVLLENNGLALLQLDDFLVGVVAQAGADVLVVVLYLLDVVEFWVEFSLPDEIVLAFVGVRSFGEPVEAVSVDSHGFVALCDELHCVGDIAWVVHEESDFSRSEGFPKANVGENSQEGRILLAVDLGEWGVHETHGPPCL